MAEDRLKDVQGRREGHGVDEEPSALLSRRIGGRPEDRALASSSPKQTAHVELVVRNYLNDPTISRLQRKNMPGYSPAVTGRNRPKSTSVPYIKGM